MTQVKKFRQSIEIIQGDKSIIGKILLVEKACLVIELNNDIIAPIELTTGTNLDYRLVAGSIIYTFVSTVIGFRVKADRTIAVLSPPRRVDENEKRKYFRMGISTKADYYLLPYKKENLRLNEVSLALYQELEDSTIIDISEGGIKIKTKEEFMKGQYALLALYIPEKTVVLGRAVRCGPNAEGRYDTAFEYLDITDSIKKNISDFIMEKSIESEDEHSV